MTTYSVLIHVEVQAREVRVYGKLPDVFIEYFTGLHGWTLVKETDAMFIFRETYGRGKGDSFWLDAFGQWLSIQEITWTVLGSDDGTTRFLLEVVK